MESFSYWLDVLGIILLSQYYSLRFFQGFIAYFTLGKIMKKYLGPLYIIF